MEVLIIVFSLLFLFSPMLYAMVTRSEKEVTIIVLNILLVSTIFLFYPVSAGFQQLFFHLLSFVALAMLFDFDNNTDEEYYE